MPIQVKPSYVRHFKETLAVDAGVTTRWPFNTCMHSYTMCYNEMLNSKRPPLARLAALAHSMFWSKRMYQESRKEVK